MENTVTKRLGTEAEETVQVPFNEVSETCEKSESQSKSTEINDQLDIQTTEKLEIQPTGMVWAVVMCLGGFQELYMKSKETLEIVRDTPSSSLLEQGVYASRAFGMLFIIYLLLRVLFDRKFLSGKTDLFKLWPLLLHALALSPFFILKLSDLALNRAEQLKTLMQWGVELLSSVVILVVYRIEDSSESPLLQMKPYVFKNQVIVDKED